MSKKLVVLFLCLGAVLFASLVEAELTVEAYVDLSIERLELAEQTWSERGEAPTKAERRVLFAKYETDRVEYLCYAGKYKKKVENYLESRSQLKGRIETLSTSVQSHAERATRQP